MPILLTMTNTKFVISQIPIPLKMTRQLTLFLALAFFSLNSPAQTNISGIVNSYYKVIEVIPAKACVRLNTTAGLSMNDKAMVVQMKGATLNTANTALPNFGDTTSLN